MNPETMAKLLEYFDLKEFFQDNSPIKLAIVWGFVLALMIGGRILSFIIQRKTEKLVAGAHGAASQQPDEETVTGMDFALFERVMQNSRWLFYLLAISWGLKQLNFGVIYAEIMRIIFTALCIWMAIRFITSFVPFVIDIKLRRHGATLKTSQSRSLIPIFKSVTWAVGLTFLLDNLGFHVSTIIAGLGIVGVAVGLAGQAILADFFSYIVILLDKPFTIGDYVELGDGKAGDVEYMGPKTTHLRNLNDDLIVCANSEMTKGVLVNQGSIHERVVVLNFGVSYSTPVKTLKAIPDMLRDLINAMPQCSFDRACLLNFGPSNLQFQIIYEVGQQRGGIRDFMITRSEVNMAILDKFDKEGISMDYPTEHVLFTDLDQRIAPKPVAQKQS